MGMITKSVMNMPLPDDPAELGVVEWLQIRDRMRDAGDQLDRYEDAMEWIRQHDPELADKAVEKFGIEN